MSKRLQVLLPDKELREIQRVAKQKHVTVAEWVRQALRAARKSESTTDASRKLDAVRQAVQYSFPAGPVDEMLAEIERGYVDDAGPR